MPAPSETQNCLFSFHPDYFCLRICVKMRIFYSVFCLLSSCDLPSLSSGLFWGIVSLFISFEVSIFNKVLVSFVSPGSRQDSRFLRFSAF